MLWQQLSITVDAPKAEQAADILTELGALSITFNDAENEELFQTQPNETPLWQKTRISALFSETEPLDNVLQAFFKALNETQPIDYTIEIIENKNWAYQTQQQFSPLHIVNKLWVLPDWCDDKTFPNPKIRLHPGLAFGTGTHATTQLCLEWLAEYPPENQEVIDYGCGSGILALAALALGAKKVWAVDHDPQALLATENNAQLNNFVTDSNLKMLGTETLPSVKVPLLIANILANPLIELAPRLMSLASDQATLVLSGVLEKQVEAVVDAYHPRFSVESVEIKEGWARLVLES